MVEIQQSYRKRSEYAEIRLYHTEVRSTDRRDLPIPPTAVLVIQDNDIYK